MEWINIHASVLDSFEFKSAEPAQQATWLKLFRYCAGQENGGVIEKAATFTDRQWQAVAGVTLEEVNKHPCGLWEWSGEDLVLNFYSQDNEDRVRAQRKAAINTNKKRHGKRHGKRDVDRECDRDAERVANERKGKETVETPPGEEEGKSAFPESVSDEVVMAFGREFPGEPASGAPVMLEAWVMDFLKRINGRREWPRDWKRLMVSSWRAEWREFSAQPVNGQGFEKNAAKKSGETDAQRVFKLDKRIAELAEQISGFETTQPELADRLERELVVLREERRVAA